MQEQNMSLLPKSIVQVGNMKLILPTEQVVNAKPKTHLSLKVFPSQSAPTTAWGQTLDFKIAPGDCQIVDDMYLQLVLPPLTVTGGTYSRFVNDSSWFLNRIEYSSNGANAPIVVKSSTAGLITYLEELSFVSDGDKTSLWVATGNNTDAIRQTNAATTQTLLIPMWNPMTQTANGFLNASTSGWVIRVTLSNLADVVQTDGSAPICPITSANILIGARAVDDQLQAALTSIMNVSRSSPTNFRYLAPTVQSGNPIVAGSTSVTIPLTSDIGSCAFAIAIVRQTAHVSTSLGNLYDQFEPISTIEMKKASGESILANPMSSTYARSILPSLMGIVGDLGDLRTQGPKNVFFIPFCEDIQGAWAYGRYTGHVDLSGSETLSISFPSATAQANVIDIVFYHWLTFEQMVDGSIHKI